MSLEDPEDYTNWCSVALQSCDEYVQALENENKLLYKEITMQAEKLAQVEDDKLAPIFYFVGGAVAAGLLFTLTK